MKRIKPADRRRSRTTYRVKKYNKGKRPVLFVFRSNKNIYAQVINVENGEVLASCSSKSKEFAKKMKGKSGIEIAKMVGEGIAKKAVENKIKKVAFNKGPYLYAGRVKALCEEARKNGLLF